MSRSPDMSTEIMLKVRIEINFLNMTWEKELVIKEGQTACLSLLFKSSTDTLIIFIFSSLLDQSIPDFVFAL